VTNEWTYATDTAGHSPRLVGRQKSQFSTNIIVIS